MHYKKYQHQQLSPRTDIPCRTDQLKAAMPRRPCIKYQPDDAETAPEPTAEIKPELTDEQALIDVEPLPALADDDVFLDSLDEYETSRDDQKLTMTMTDVEQQHVLTADTDNIETGQQPDEQLDDPPLQEPNISNITVPDTLPPTDPEPVAECVPIDEPPVELVTEVVIAGETETIVDEVTDGQAETTPTDDEDLNSISVQLVDVNVQDTTSHPENDQV